jgi:large subunit ribosomal protein L24
MSKRAQENLVRHVVNIRKGDQVRVMTGRDKGKQGRVLSVDAVKLKVTVEHANMIKRHTRPNPSKNIKGGIVEREGPMAISNVLVVCPGCGKASRVGHKIETVSVTVRNADGSEAEHTKRRLVGRTCRRCGATI